MCRSLIRKERSISTLAPSNEATGGWNGGQGHRNYIYTKQMKFTDALKKEEQRSLEILVVDG